MSQREVVLEYVVGSAALGRVFGYLLAGSERRQPVSQQDRISLEAKSIGN